jgi:hypothetical protein
MHSHWLGHNLKRALPTLRDHWRCSIARRPADAGVFQRPLSGWMDLVPSSFDFGEAVLAEPVDFATGLEGGDLGRGPVHAHKHRLVQRTFGAAAAAFTRL